METETLDRTYQAFISYRHADNKIPGRQWATWLHQAIETYEIPDDLVGTTNQSGEKIPSRIFPIFRDEEELPAHADLGNAITLALDNTETLVVICSPNAVQSTYVADEIDYFKQVGKSDRLIAAIIDGEPNCSWDKSKEALGFKPEDECFPIPLQFEYNEQGRTDKKAEPIAADFRVNEDGRPQEGWTSPEAYRSKLLDHNFSRTEIESRVEAYSSQLHLMKLKIIAGILRIPLGHLTKRDQAYQLAQEKERAKKLRQWLTAIGLLAVVAVSTGVWAWTQRQVALENERVAVERLLERQVSDANRLTNEAIEYIDNGNATAALERLNDAIPENIYKPEWPISDKTAAVLNRAIAKKKNSVVIATDIDTFSLLKVIDERHLIAVSDKNRVVKYTKQGELVSEWTFAPQMLMHVTQDNQRLVGAAIINREEPTPEGSIADTKYVDYFVSKTLDLYTGEILNEVELKLGEQSISYSNIFASLSEERIFSPDGSRYLAYKEDYSDDDTTYSFIVIDTSSGEFIFEAPISHYPRSVLAIDNENFVVLQTRYADENTPYLSQLIHVSSASNNTTTLWQSNEMLACRDGRLQSAADDNRADLSVSISDQFNAIVAMWKPSYSQGRFCLKSFSLEDFSQSSLVAIDYAEDIELNKAEKEVLDSALTTHPLLVYSLPSGDFYAANKSPVSSVIMSNETYYADESVIIANNHSFSPPDDAGQLEQLAFDDEFGQLWYASVDRSIRNFIYRGSEQRYNMELSLYSSKVWVLDDSIIVLDEEATELKNGQWQNTFWVINPEHSDGIKSFTIEGIDQFPSFYLYPNNVIAVASVAPDAEDLDSFGSKQINISLIGINTGELLYSFDVIDMFKEVPTHTKNHIALIKDELLKVIDIKSFEKMTYDFPSQQTPFEVFILEETIVIAALDKPNDPDNRVITLYKLSSDLQELQVLASKQAQSLQVIPMKHKHSALLEWDIRYDKPKEFQKINADLKILDIAMGWEDSFGQEFLLPQHSDHIYVVTDYKYAQKFDFQGQLLSETITQTDWYNGFLSYDTKYLLSDDAILPLAGSDNCELLNNENLSRRILQISPKSQFLAFSDANNTFVYDLISCAISYEIPVGASTSNNLAISDTGVLYLLTSQGLQIHSTSNTVEENVAILRR
ncbi:MAG: hypothetical protein ACI9O6_001273 [Glaciecola sp.]|jgi:hypothetical protein